jgi:PAS domain S-box-containing protein
MDREYSMWNTSCFMVLATSTQTAKAPSMSRPIQLLDLVSREKLERILQVFTEVTKVASIIAYVDGHPITRPHNFTPFCLHFCRSTSEGRAKCHESDRHGGEQSAQSRKTYIYSCLNSGLIDCAAPVIVENYHLATILAGQVLEGPIPEHLAIERAEAIGITDIDGYVQALGKVPLMKRQRLLAIVNLMSEITKTVSELALQKYRLDKQSQQYLGKLINSVSDCIISTNADNSVTMVNQAGAKMFGYEMERLIGRSILDLFGDENSKATYKKNVDSRLISSWRAELTGTDAGGQNFPVQVSFSAINDGSARNVGCVGVIRDVSEEKKLEKMKEDLIGMITHDMRNPVLSIQKALELVVNGTLGPLNEHQKSIMGLAVATGHQLFGMVSDILDIYRNENGQFVLHRTPVVMQQIILESVSQLDLFAREKHLSVQFEPLPLPLEVLGDRKRLRRTCVNLLENAIKYSPEGSSIRIEAAFAKLIDNQSEHPVFSRRSVVHANWPSEYVIVSFTDYGIGIPAEYHQCIFDKYFTIKTDDDKPREGVGLGLAFCRQVVGAHGGLIWVESPVREHAADSRRGCRFYLTLPLNGAECRE